MNEPGIILSPEYIRWVFGVMVAAIGSLIALVYGHLLSRLKKAEDQIVIRQELQHKDRAVLAETTDRVTLLEYRIDDHFAELRLLTKMVSEIAGWDEQRIALAKHDARNEAKREGGM
jgi:hypothetical protein